VEDVWDEEGEVDVDNIDVSPIDDDEFVFSIVSLVANN